MACVDECDSDCMRDVISLSTCELCCAVVVERGVENGIPLSDC